MVFCDSFGGGVSAAVAVFSAHGSASVTNSFYALHRLSVLRSKLLSVGACDVG